MKPTVQSITTSRITDAAYRLPLFLLRILAWTIPPRTHHAPLSSSSSPSQFVVGQSSSDSCARSRLCRSINLRACLMAFRASCSFDVPWKPVFSSLTIRDVVVVVVIVVAIDDGSRTSRHVPLVDDHLVVDATLLIPGRPRFLVVFDDDDGFRDAKFPPPPPPPSSSVVAIAVVVVVFVPSFSSSVPSSSSPSYSSESKESFPAGMLN